MIATDHPLRLGVPPAWASAWGHDNFGPWCALQFGGIEQVLRWIPPGDFQMGSPNEDKEAIEREFPQHWVSISRGFWMFDSPCPQALWSAVMGNEPSHFKGPNRPVERVSWEDCHQFVDKLNLEFEDLNMRLPTEAEWEYACRAGIKESRFGKLDEVVWHLHNSKLETHDVKLLQANPWGLFDMLGNVWEWCEDSWLRSYDGAAAVAPFQLEASAAARVIRGGSWYDSALSARAAYRGGSRRSNRDGNLGFRCLSSAEPKSRVFGGAETSGGVYEPSRSRSDRSRE